MTKVIINPGNCGFSVDVTVNKKKDGKAAILIDTECEMVLNMLDDISLLETRASFTGYLNNPVYRSAAMHLQHVACPVPVGILKALEVEMGLCVSEEVRIKFSK
jgi:hypothetical protein